MLLNIQISSFLVDFFNSYFIFLPKPATQTHLLEIFQLKTLLRSPKLAFWKEETIKIYIFFQLKCDWKRLMWKKHGTLRYFCHKSLGFCFFSTLEWVFDREFYLGTIARVVENASWYQVLAFPGTFCLSRRSKLHKTGICCPLKCRWGQKSDFI